MLLANGILYIVNGSLFGQQTDKFVYIEETNNTDPVESIFEGLGADRFKYVIILLIFHGHIICCIQ